MRVVRRWRIIIPATSPTPSPRLSVPFRAAVEATVRREEHRVYHPAYHADEDGPEQKPGPIDVPSRLEPFPHVAHPSATELGFAFGSEGEAVLDATTAFEDVWVGRGRVAFAYHVGGAKLELRWERGGAGPLDAVKE